MNCRWKTILKVSNKPQLESENSMKYMSFLYSQFFNYKQSVLKSSKAFFKENPQKEVPQEPLIHLS